MDFSKLIVVSGKTGVFRVISQGRSGLIVESLVDGKKIPIPFSYRSTSLKDIVVFTETEEVPLLKVFNKIKEHTQAQQAISHKEPDQVIRAFFEEVLPEYDRTRVHLSDMRKIIQWYNILQQNGIMDFEEEQKNEKETTENRAEAVKTMHPDETPVDADAEKAIEEEHKMPTQLDLFGSENQDLPEHHTESKRKKTTTKKSSSDGAEKKRKK